MVRNKPVGSDLLVHMVLDKGFCEQKCESQWSKRQEEGHMVGLAITMNTIPCNYKVWDPSEDTVGRMQREGS